MDADLQVARLATADAAAALAELAAPRDRVYYDALAADGYHRGALWSSTPHPVVRSHARRPAYKPARELYPRVDLQTSGMPYSLYAGHRWETTALIRADLAIALACAQRPELRSPG